MGCGCGGGAASAGTTGLIQYRLTYPDGRKQVYLHKEQAEREASKSGASLEIIEV